jgi:hypothetical protein
VEPDRENTTLADILAFCQKGVDLIEKTASRTDRQMMLGCLVRDLASAERLLPGAPPGLIGEYLTLRSRAATWRKRVGPPISFANLGKEADRDRDSGTARRAPAGKARRGPATPSHPRGAGAIRPLRRVGGGGESGRSTSPEPLRDLRRKDPGSGRVAETPAEAEPQGRPTGLNKPLTFLDKFPQARFLVEAGIKPASAVKLVRAGYTSLESLARASKDDLLSVRGIGTGTLEQLEGLLGHQLRSPADYWREKGLLPKYAEALGRAGIDSVQALEKKSRKELRALGLGNLGLQKCEELLGRPLDPPADPKQASGRTRITRVPGPDVKSTQGEGRRVVEEPSPAQSSQVRAEWEALHRRLLEMLVPLQSGESSPPEGAEVRLRLALWNAAREVASLLGGAPPGFDLTRNDAATGEAVYSYVVQQYF